MQFGGHHLRHRGIDRVEFAGHEQLDALVGEDPRHHAARLEIGQDELGVLEIGDALPERAALGCVIDRPVDDRFDDRGRSDRLGEPFLRELGHHQLEALALRGEHRGGGNAQVVEKQLRRILRLHPQLIEVFAALEAGQAGIDEEQRDALGTRAAVGFGGKHQHVAHLAVRDEHLLAIDQEMRIAVPLGFGADRLEVAPGVGFGHPERADRLALDHSGQPLALLFFGSGGQDIGGDEIGVDQEAGAAGTHPPQFLVNDHVEQIVEPKPAVFLGHCAAQHPGLARLEP